MFIDLDSPRVILGETAGQELADFPAGLLRELPVESVFVLDVPGIPCDVHIINRELPEPREAPDAVVFDALELEALRVGAGCDRLWPVDMLEICMAKWGDPGHRLDLDRALSGATGAPPDLARGPSLPELLDRLGARLVATRLQPAPVVALELAA